MNQYRVVFSYHKTGNRELLPGTFKSIDAARKAAYKRRKLFPLHMVSGMSYSIDMWSDDKNNWIPIFEINCRSYRGHRKPKPKKKKYTKKHINPYRPGGPTKRSK